MHLASARGHEPGADERPAARAASRSGWIDDALRRARTRIGFDALERDRRAVHARARRARSATSPPATLARRGRADRHRRARCCRPCCRASTSPTRRPPRRAQVNNLHLLRGMLGRPGRRRAADERPADRAEHARDRRRRRPARASATGTTPRTSASSPSCGTSTPGDDPALGAADPRDADLALRRAGLDRAAVDLARPTRPCRCPTSPASARILRARGAVRRRAGPVPDRDRRARRRRAARRRPGARRPARFTNADRTVHLSERAVDPPGEARADLDIFLDYARRMDFRDRDGAPLITWDDAEGAFEAWKACSRGPAVRLHRASAYDRLRDARRDPVAVHRRRARRHRAALHRRRLQHRPGLLRDLRPGPRHRAPRSPRTSTAPRSPAAGRSCTPPTTSPSPEAPERRVPAAAHDRPHASTTSTPAPRPAARRELQAAAPDVWVELSRRDAAALGIAEGDLVARRVAARRDRGAARGSAASAPGVVFVPFHYGYWDAGDGDRTRAPPTS